MTAARFTLDDLLQILTVTAGLAPEEHTTDPTVTLEAVGLDSLAFLALQTELQDRYGFELPDEVTAEATLGEMADHVDARLSGAVAEAS